MLRHKKEHGVVEREPPAGGIRGGYHGPDDVIGVSLTSRD